MLVQSSIEILWQPQFALLFGGVEGNSIYFGIALGGSFFVSMVGSLFSIPLCKIFKQRFGLVSALFQGLYVLSLMLLALQTSVPLAFVFFWLILFNIGVVSSPHMTLLNNEIPSKHRSSMLSINSFIGTLGAIIGTVVLSFIAEQESISLSWLIGGAVLIVTVFIYLRIDSIKKGEVKTRPVKNKS
jgi:MFS family permease